MVNRLLYFAILASILVFSNLASVHSNASTKNLKDDKLVKVLLLTYNNDAEHNVIQSLLCAGKAEACTEKNNCPEEYLQFSEKIKDKPDIFINKNFVIFRPLNPGSPQAMVNKFKNLYPDLISMSGHQSSGFFGNKGGHFKLEKLEIYNKPGELDSLFGSPSLTFLNGCNTAVNSTFIGDPFAYIRHIIEDVEEIESEYDRLITAINQISGIQSSYRQIFPNSCIMGYEGSSKPGGVPEVYTQYTNTLRAIYSLEKDRQQMYKVSKDPSIDLLMRPKLRLSGPDATRHERADRISQECPGRSWPCNLCKSDPGYYGELNASLAKYLRRERARKNADNASSYSEQEVTAINNVFTKSRAYKYTKWSCSDALPGTSPILPDITQLPDMATTLLKLLFIPKDKFTPVQFVTIQDEVLHQLAYLRISDEELSKLRKFVAEDEKQEDGINYRKELLALADLFNDSKTGTPLRDFYNIALKLQCSECVPTFDVPEDGFMGVISSMTNSNNSYSPSQRIALASALEPSMGEELYMAALQDSEDSVVVIASEKLGAPLGIEVYTLALEQKGDVRNNAIARMHMGLGGELIKQQLLDKDTPVKVRAKLAGGIKDPSEDVYTAVFSPDNNLPLNIRVSMASLTAENLSADVLASAIIDPELSVAESFINNHPIQKFTKQWFDTLLLKALESPHEKLVFYELIQNAPYPIDSITTIQKISAKYGKDAIIIARYHSADSDPEVIQLLAEVGGLKRSAGLIRHVWYQKNLVSSIVSQFSEGTFAAILKGDYPVDFKRNIAEKLGPQHSASLYEYALNHSDEYVRSGAARRLSEKNDYELFIQALTDKTFLNVRWAAAAQLNQNSDRTLLEYAMGDGQEASIKTIAAQQALQTNYSDLVAKAKNILKSEQK